MKALLSRATLASLLLGASMLASAADLPRTPAPAGAEVFIVSPKDGATVDKTFTVKFGIKGLDLEPIDKQVPGAGHHHLLVDQEVGRSTQTKRSRPRLHRFTSARRKPRPS